jgi:hypothetical protein
VPELGVVAPPEPVGNREDVRAEHEVEPALLEHPPDPLVVAGRQQVQVRVGVPPAAVVTRDGAGREERGQVHLLAPPLAL